LLKFLSTTVFAERRKRKNAGGDMPARETFPRNGAGPGGKGPYPKK